MAPLSPALPEEDAKSDSPPPEQTSENSVTGMNYKIFWYLTYKILNYNLYVPDPAHTAYTEVFGDDDDISGARAAGQGTNRSFRKYSRGTQRQT